MLSPLHELIDRDIERPSWVLFLVMTTTLFLILGAFFLLVTTAGTLGRFCRWLGECLESG